MSCNQYKLLPPDVEATLSCAGDNREELSKVLQYYYNQHDTLKIQAAFFLIGNMKDQYSYGGIRYNQYLDFIDSIFQKKENYYNVEELQKKFQKKYNIKSRSIRKIMIPDCYSMKAKCLIDNIDNAFTVWDRKGNISFKNFCEFILPYKVYHEKIEDWRTLWRKKYGSCLASDTISSIETACNLINNNLKNNLIQFDVKTILNVDYPAHTLMNMKFGHCGNLAAMATYAMRANGIPVGVCLIPHWGNKSGSHMFNVVLGDDGHLHDFLGGDTNVGMHLKNIFPPKVYLKTFGIQESSLAMIHGKEQIPDMFKNPYLKDVTSDLDGDSAKNIIIKLPYNIDNNFAYLCVFDIDGWIPVAWGQVMGTNILFKSIGIGTVYQLAIFKNNKFVLVNNPFYLSSLGNIEYYTPKTQLIEKVFERKYPILYPWDDIAWRLVGGKFEGSNTSDFKKKVILASIDTIPPLKYVSSKVNVNQPLKYIRYVGGKMSNCNLAELEFYGNDTKQPLNGIVYGAYKRDIKESEYRMEALFDGDPNTYLKCADSINWVGIKLKKPTRITKIRYLIHNDGNRIRKGDCYELFYANEGHWISLGKQVAQEEDRIEFKRLPKGALFWLHDISGGIEERIFELDNNNNIIWR